MSDLLIRNIDQHLKRQLQSSARAHRRSLSEEARLLLKQALREPAKQPKKGLGTAMRELIPKECLGDDLVFEVPGEVSEPPDFR
jgi:plasmid stability protein